MSKKRKGRFTLLETLEFLDETTIVGDYPGDGTGVSDGDDTPTSNILMAPKYKQIPYYNRLTSFDKNWDHDDSEWYWDIFKNAQGQEDIENYSNTLQGMKDLFPEEDWNIAWRRIRKVSDKEAERKFRISNQPYRKAKDQLGVDKEDHIEVKTSKNKQNFKKSEIKKESSLTKKIDHYII